MNHTYVWPEDFGAPGDHKPVRNYDDELAPPVTFESPKKPKSTPHGEAQSNGPSKSQAKRDWLKKQSPEKLAEIRERNRLRMKANAERTSRDGVVDGCKRCGRRKGRDGVCNYDVCILERQEARVLSRDGDMCSMCMQRKKTGDVLCGARHCRERLANYLLRGGKL